MIKEENYSQDIHHCHVSNQLKMKTAESEKRLQKREEKLKTQVNSLGLKHFCRKTSLGVETKLPIKKLQAHDD